MKVRVRLAPSPTGTLHLGTARTALFNWLFAKEQGGAFLLRIEDTDKERSKEEFTRSILNGLKWLGISWDEQPVIQSERVAKHQAVIKQLLENGLAYRCYATEKELEDMRNTQKARGEAPRYDNRSRNLSKEEEEIFIKEGRTSVIRFRIDDNEDVSWNDLVRGKMHWKAKDLGGDMVISRRSCPNEIGDPLYNLVVVIDDSFMNITHVIRGEDHISNTAKQILLYKALKLPTPIFAHTPLILNSEGKKLSKRDGVTSINEFKEMGYTAEALSNYMALLGWSPPEGVEEIFDIKKIYKEFKLERVSKSGAKFDWEKLNWINSQVIHESPPELLFQVLNPKWAKKGWELKNEELGISLIELIRPSMVLIEDGVTQAKPFFEEPSLLEEAIEQLSVEGAREGIQELLNTIDNQKFNELDELQAKQLINSSAKVVGIKKGLLMKSLRAALLGELNGPDLIQSWVILSRLGKDRIRIQRCL